MKGLTLSIPAGAPAVHRDLCGTRILVMMPSIPVLGMERANLQIMKMMQERGADVRFVVSALPGEKVTREVERLGMRSEAAMVTERPRLPKGIGDAFQLTAAWIRGARDIDRIFRRFRPTHIHLTSLAAALYGLPTLARARCPVVLRLPNPPDRRLGGRKQAIADAVWTRVVDPLCGTIVCNSRYSYEQLRATGLTAAKLQIIQNAVAQRPPTIRSDVPRFDPAHFNVVFAGQLTPEKGIEPLLDAARELVREHGDIRFYLAGWRSPYAETLVGSIEASGLGSRIRFIGEVEDVPGLLAQSDLHVCPSVFEDPSPNVVLEAKHQGVASVVFPSGGIPELVTHGVDGFICREKNAAALRDGILHFFHDREALRAVSEAARQSLARFSPERIAAEWAEVFRVPAPRPDPGTKP